MLKSKLVVKKRNRKLPKPKITLDRLGQIIFIFREVIKIAFRVKPKLLIAILIINSILGFSSVLVFYLEKLIIDNLIDAIGTDDIRPVLITLSLLLTAGILISVGRQLLNHSSGFLRRYLVRYFEVEIDVLIGRKVSTLDIKTLENPDFRDKLNKIYRESGRRAWQLIMPLSEMPNYIFGFLTATAVIIYIHPLVSVVVLFLSIPRILVNQKYIKKRYVLQSSLSSNNRIWGWLRHYVIENRNFLELKLLNISDFLVDKLSSTAHEVVDSLYNLGRKHLFARTWTHIPLAVFEFIVAIFLVYWVIIKRITVGTFQLYLRSFRSVQDNVAAMVTSLLSIYENYIYVSDLVWLLKLKSRIDEGGGVEFHDKKVKVKFDNVWFKYRKDTPWVIKGVDFKIKAGEKIAIVGENGVGKTTLIKLFARYYDPEKGKILLNNKDLKSIIGTSWRGKLAILFQQFEKYPFSVKETVGYGDIDRIDDIKDIKKMVKKVDVDKYVESLPLKYDNPLAPELEKGTNPSTGQWQRLGIARMLFREKASVLILDEPTSNLDPEAEENIFKELAEITKDKILIFITQRFSTVRVADRILVMHDGKIIEQGTHKDLMKLGGKYAKMFNIQARAYLEN